MLDFPRWKVLSIFGILLALMALAIPSFFPEDQTRNWPVHPRVHLGLDLAGGVALTLEANTDDLVKTRIDNMREQVLNEMRRDPKIDIGPISTDNGKVSFMLRNVGQLEEARQRLVNITGGGAGLSGQRVWDIAVVNSSTFELTPTKAGMDQAITDAMSNAVDVIRKRLDKFGTTEPDVRKQGSNRISVKVPGVKDPQALKELVGKTAKLEFRMVDDTPVVPGKPLPFGTELLPYPEGGQDAKILVQRRAIITGDQLLTASQGYKPDEPTKPIVNFGFDSAGGKKFAQITQTSQGKRFAVVVDGQVISAPVINGPILGGQGYIEGNFTVQSANNLAISLSSGKLQVDLKVVEESTVGSELGKDSIRAGITASILAVVLVVIFMLVTYGRFGLYADWAVVINVVVIMGVLALINGTLTLPGIAGFVLTIGTAVDANVLINERIREERRRGRSVIQAVDLGYKEASRTIFEANVTHAISGVIMAAVGTGPVQGFAIVLLIGICTSVFTAVTFTRMLVVLWLRKHRPQTINI
ncbi:MAG: protein translocase subunit SecD [Sphingomonas sp.]|uniref:protein translocase subunit SecD n=1 Tax=Sphingomonas sp. TaxID=28214 RepID=UPI003F7FF763